MAVSFRIADAVRPVTACQARVPDYCSGVAQHRHHLLMRSRGGSDRPENLLPVCLACHEFIHRYPAEAHDRGLLRHSWEGEP